MQLKTHISCHRSYLQFSNIAARCVRRALKPEKSQNVLNREGQVMKMTKWSNGKAAEKSGMCCVFVSVRIVVAISSLVAETLVFSFFYG